MHKCQDPCIYYHEIHDKSKKPSVRVVCDIREGEEIKNISPEEIENCEHYKTYIEVKSKFLSKII